MVAHLDSRGDHEEGAGTSGGSGGKEKGRWTSTAFSALAGGGGSPNSSVGF